MLIDTHAHLDADKFDADRDEVVARAKEAGVTNIIAIGTTAEDSARVLELAQQYEGVFASVGIHPNNAAEAQPGDWDRIVELAQNDRAVALGETGLDRYWHDTPFELQQDYFDRHLRLMQATELPVVIHMRDCQADVLAMLRDACTRGPLRGVMHSYTGDAAGAAECCELGLFISFAGMVTYKKSQDLRDVAAGVPADRILVETDSPYLSPEPLRGKRNEPANVVHTARVVAAARGMSYDDFAARTTANAQRLFNLPSF
ncbi:MAG TPA: TatD family hydrolase [Pirellulales bacterium]|jgi:TatD DNase family protein|nr:TatD family hydrolase [Pirellulales bacterium]